MSYVLIIIFSPFSDLRCCNLTMQAEANDLRAFLLLCEESISEGLISFKGCKLIKLKLISKYCYQLS